MPLKGMTYARFKEHIRHHALLYLVGIIVMVFLSDILYSCTQPTTPLDKQVMIYLAAGYSDTDNEIIDALEQRILTETQETCEDLQEVCIQAMSMNDPDEDYTSSYLLMTRMASNEADAFIACDYAATSIMDMLGAQSLDEWLEEGWLSEYDLKPVIYEYEDDETGETVSYTAALEIDPTVLQNIASYSGDPCYLIIAGASTNQYSTRVAVENFIAALYSGEYDNVALATEEP